MSRFCFCNCPAGFSAEPERHAPDCPGRSGAGKVRTPVPATTPALKVTAAEELDAVLHWRGKHAQAIKERDALQQLLNQRDEQVESLKLRTQGESVTIEAVAVTRDNGDGSLRLEWLLEGGIAQMELAGMVLFAIPEANDICDEDGSSEVYLTPPNVEQSEPVDAPLDYGSLDAVQRLAVCRGEVAPVSGSTCNEIREEAGQPINRPCKACGGGACIDR